MTVLNFPASPSVNDTYTENNVTYTWNGSYWEANNTGSLDDIYVEVSGDVMTGNLLLPGGGGNTAALQKQEITDLPVSTFDNDSGYITSSDIPPGTVSYWNKDGSDLKPVTDTDNVNIGDGKILLNADGGASFKQDVNILQAALLVNNGNSAGNVFEATLFNSTDITASINAVGSAYFKEQVQSDNLFAAKNGTTTPDSGHQVWYGLNNAGEVTSEIFADGRLDIGGLLPTAPNITLGSAGNIISKSYIISDREKANDAALLARLAGTKTMQVFGDGTTMVGGTIGSDVASSAPKISLNADGSSEFAGGKIKLETDGQIVASGSSANTNVFVAQLNGTSSASIFADGSAEFASTVRVAQDSGGGYINPNTATNQFEIVSTPNGAINVEVRLASGGNGAYIPFNGTSWSPFTSESRLKDIIGDVDKEQSWDLIRDIELKRYFYKDQDTKFRTDTRVSYAGPMADWLGKQDPELLIDTGRSDDEGSIHTFNQGLLDMKALQALSTALTRIEELEARLDAAGV